MKVLSVYYTHKPGGLCKRLYRLLGALSERGHEVTYLSLDPAPEELNQRVRCQRVPFPLKSRSGLIFWGIFTLWLPIYCLIASLKLKPDRLVAFSPYYATALILTKWLTRSPIVLFVRALSAQNDLLSDKNPILLWIVRVFEQFGLICSSKIVCLTHTMSQLVESHTFFSPEIVILPNDLPSAIKVRSSNDKKNKFTLVCAGVLEKRKNISTLLKAIATLKVTQDFLVLIAGDGPLRRGLEDEASALLLSNVSFLGWVDDLTPVLERSDALIHPSLHEGMPNIILEALSVGIPVIASNTPELRELLKYDELLFNPTEPKEIGKRLCDLLHTESRKRIIDLSRKRAVEYCFNWNELASQIVESANGLQI